MLASMLSSSSEGAEQIVKEDWVVEVSELNVKSLMSACCSLSIDRLSTSISSRDSVSDFAIVRITLVIAVRCCRNSMSSSLSSNAPISRCAIPQAISTYLVRSSRKPHQPEYHRYH